MNELKDKFYEDFQDCENNPEGGFLTLLKQYSAVELKTLLNIKQCECD
ncbi:hypothetical protein [Methanobrevibacter arboriphilus]|nr:hypothetical protein [Methanobrevibacter arboriphilus]